MTRSIVVTLTGNGLESEQHRFARREITLGRSMVCECRLDADDVSRRHARIALRADGDCLVEDLGSVSGTFVNGRKVVGADGQLVTSSDLIIIGSYFVRVGGYEGERELLPVEDELVAAIARGETGACEVYADWLEERGETWRLEFVRLQRRDDPASVTRRIAIGDRFDPRWRAQIELTPAPDELAWTPGRCGGPDVLD